MPAPFQPQTLFSTSHRQDVVSNKFLWSAILTACVVANAPPRTLIPIGVQLLHAVPTSWLAYGLAGEDLWAVSRNIVLLLIVPIKKLCFFLALAVIGYPVIKALMESGSSWKSVEVKRIAWAALVVLGGLSLLIVPFAKSDGTLLHHSGLGGLGVLFGEMSVAPFASSNDIVYGRLLKPAVAHFIHLDGYVRYYLFSLICTYMLIFLTLFFFESKLFSESPPIGRRIRWERWLIYFSVMTSSFIMTSFQSPGKVDHVIFIFVLLMVCVPLTPQARLGLVALCTLTHESIALSLLPIIILWFPKEERFRAVAAVGLFFVVMAASYGLNPSKALQGHGTTVNEGSVWQVALHHPGYFIMGLFFSYKLIWGIFFLVVRRLWMHKVPIIALQLAAVTLFPISLCVLAWDTSRIAGIGFLGMLVAILIIVRTFDQMPRLHRHLLMVAVYANVVIPSYNVILYPPVGNGPPIYLNTLAEYPYLGLYQVIHSVIRILLS